jgi:3-hydroxy-9,10-secoandrosta-1,3,5(10)-triene-9,17-dione monooxygenase reductase component
VIEIDDLTFRSILRLFASGITVVTTLDGDRPWGTTANSFSSVSLHPPLVLVAFDRRRRIVEPLRRTGRYVVNILGEDDRALSDCFAGGPASSGRDELCGAKWHVGSLGLPVLDAAIASLECSIVDIHPAGDHDLYIAQVEHASAVSGDALPLLYYSGRYLRIERASLHDLKGKPEK